MTSRAAIGSIAGSTAPRQDRRPNMRGAMTLETDLKAGTRLWLSAWAMETAGAAWISISAEVADHGGHNRKRRR